MKTISPELTATSSIISRHGHPQPRQYRFVVLIVRLGIAFLLAAILTQLLLAWLFGPLLLGSALFSTILLLMMWMRSAQFPTVTVLEDGLRIIPMVGQIETLPWESIVKLVVHPLLYKDVTLERKLHGRDFQPPEGVLIVLSTNTHITFPYYLIGLFTGEGAHPAFGISTATHQDYASLIEHISQSTGLTIEPTTPSIS